LCQTGAPHAGHGNRADPPPIDIEENRDVIIRFIRAVP
jgi:hypothetical protein